jgi:hypothetical protein
MTNGPDGPLPEWWDKMMDEVLTESRKMDPDRKSRQAKKVKKRPERVGCR